MQNKQCKVILASSFLGLLFVILFSSFQVKKTVWLSSLDLTKMVQGWDKPIIDINKNKKPLSIKKQVFEKGVGTHVKSYVWINLDGGSDRFMAYAGVDDDTSNISVEGTHRFKIYADGKLLWQSKQVSYGETATKVDINVKGIKTLILEVINIGENDSNLQLDWADARFIVSGENPKTINPPREKEVILTPKPGLQPHINGPKVYGCRSGNPFLYRIPATGIRPMRFTADHLPAGLSLNDTTGIISGSIAKRGDFDVELHVNNAYGTDSRMFKIRCGDILALTPTMGWNDWYAHYWRITGKMMREAADIILSSGMADAGYQYVNIDDCWMNTKSNKDAGRVGPLRDTNGNILSNSYFPDMKAMTDYIHTKGLKAGIYSSPGPETCDEFAGSYQHEAQDAKQFAKWGFDFLKYDWCSYGNTLDTKDTTSERFKKPYRLMGSILKEQKRDIVLNLCEYGMDEVWKWGFEVGGSSWRTGGDLGFGLNGLFHVAFKNAGYAAYSKPGAWNDPDYIQIGYVGNAFGGGLPVHTNLTPNEQYAFMSMWCLLAAPLVYSADLSKLDEFTLNVLCNPEVIEIDQDPLGKAARVIRKTEESFVLIRELEDGNKAVGLCNSGEIPLSMKLTWSEAGIEGKQVIRNPWKQKNIGIYQDKFSVTVPRHSVVMIKISKEVE
jgi:Alpha-galactosidase